MIRTQVQLTAGQLIVLRELALDRRQSLAELIRQSIDLFIKNNNGARNEMQRKRQRAKLVVGEFSADVSDLSTNHDHYLVEAYSNGRYTDNLEAGGEERAE